MTLIERLEKAGEGSRLMLVDLNAAPFTREFFDALNGYATGGSGRCLETLAIWNAHLAASPSVGGWEDDPYLATDLALVNDLIYQHGGDAALAGWVRLCRRIIAAPPPPSVSTGSRPQEAVPTEQAGPAVVPGWDQEICTGCTASLSIADIKARGIVSCCPDRHMVRIGDLVDAYTARPPTILPQTEKGS